MNAQSAVLAFLLFSVGGAGLRTRSPYALDRSDAALTGVGIVLLCCVPLHSLQRLLPRFRPEALCPGSLAGPCGSGWILEDRGREARLDRCSGGSACRRGYRTIHPKSARDLGWQHGSHCSGRSSSHSDDVPAGVLIRDECPLPPSGTLECERSPTSRLWHASVCRSRGRMAV